MKKITVVTNGDLSFTWRKTKVLVVTEKILKTTVDVLRREKENGKKKIKMKLTFGKVSVTKHTLIEVKMST